MGRMLKAVTTGRQKAPLKEFVYGVPGVGKTTFGAESPSPIFLGEDGTKGLDVARFPAAKTWVDVRDSVLELTREKHEYATLVIDTADHVAALVEGAVSAREERAFGDIPFGKGPDHAVDYWRELLRLLDELQVARGTNVILLAHAQVKTFKNPTGDDYDRYAPRLHEKVAALVTGWAESVLFASYDVTVKKGAKRDLKGKAFEFERWLYTTKIAAADAKNRHDLPSRIPLSFPEFARLLERGDLERVSTLRSSAEELLGQVLDVAKRARAAEALAKAGKDLKALRAVVSRLSATIADQEDASDAEAVTGSVAGGEEGAPRSAEAPAPSSPEDPLARLRETIEVAIAKGPPEVALASRTWLAEKARSQSELEKLLARIQLAGAGAPVPEFPIPASAPASSQPLSTPGVPEAGGPGAVGAASAPPATPPPASPHAPEGLAHAMGVPDDHPLGAGSRSILKERPPSLPWSLEELVAYLGQNGPTSILHAEKALAGLRDPKASDPGANAPYVNLLRFSVDRVESILAEVGVGFTQDRKGKNYLAAIRGEQLADVMARIRTIAFASHGAVGRELAKLGATVGAAS